jgi:signal transduction histidine kinase
MRHDDMSPEELERHFDERWRRHGHRQPPPWVRRQMMQWWMHHRMRNRMFVWFGATIALAFFVGNWLHDQGHGGAWPMLAGLFILWMATGAIAFRITRPLVEVVRAARAIGGGDLTARVQARQRGDLGIVATAINEMATRIEKQLKDQRQMLAAVSHELRTPLGHIRVLVETARDAPGGPDARVLDEIEREVVDLDRLVDKLLASSRLELSVDKREVDVAQLAEVALDQAGVARGVLEFRGNAVATADATLVRRAIANLIDNARVHGGGVRAVRVERRGAEVVVEVDDGGAGVPEAERERVFEPFERAGRGGSLGLGLALVRRIAAAHGGRAWIEDAPGGGARVAFAIAVAPSAA